ncbi:MAG: hypothetical protein IKD37_04630 [Clostridia bacterium]|nr:hypothetical protein [Clostridia bacterium]
MKKLTFALVAIMLLTCIAVPSVSAADDLSKNLIAWWNFEGATKEEQLADKSIGGKVADPLTMGGDLSKIENGVAYIDHEKGNYLSVAASDDVKDLSNFTLYFRVATTGTHNSSNAAEIYKAHNSIRTFWWPMTSGGTIQSWIYGKSSNKVSDTTFKYDNMFDGFIYYAFTVKTEGGKSTFTSYLSRDGKTYQANSETFDTGVLTLEAGQAIFFGKTHATVDSRGVSFQYDDIRLYNKALSADEVAGLAEDGGTKASVKPVETTTAAPVTTAAPATTKAPAQTPATADMMPVMVVGCMMAAALVLGFAKKQRD